MARTKRRALGSPQRRYITKAFGRVPVPPLRPARTSHYGWARLIRADSICFLMVKIPKRECFTFMPSLFYADTFLPAGLVERWDAAAFGLYRRAKESAKGSTVPHSQTNLDKATAAEIRTLLAAMESDC